MIERDIEEFEREVAKKLINNRGFQEEHLRKTFFNYASQGERESAKGVLGELKRKYRFSNEDPLIYLAAASLARRLKQNDFAKLMYGIAGEYSPQIKEDVLKLAEMLDEKEEAA